MNKPAAAQLLPHCDQGEDIELFDDQNSTKLVEFEECGNPVVVPLVFPAQPKRGRGRPRKHPLRDPSTIIRRASHAKDQMAIRLDLKNRNRNALRALIRAHPAMAREIYAKKQQQR